MTHQRHSSTKTTQTAACPSAEDNIKAAQALLDDFLNCRLAALYSYLRNASVLTIEKDQWEIEGFLKECGKWAAILEEAINAIDLTKATGEADQ